MKFESSLARCICFFHTLWHINSPTPRMFVSHFSQANNKKAKLLIIGFCAGDPRETTWSVYRHKLGTHCSIFACFIPCHKRWGSPNCSSKYRPFSSGRIVLIKEDHKIRMKIRKPGQLRKATGFNVITTLLTTSVLNDCLVNMWAKINVVWYNPVEAEYRGVKCATVSHLLPTGIGLNSKQLKHQNQLPSVSWLYL